MINEQTEPGKPDSSLPCARNHTGTKHVPGTAKKFSSSVVVLFVCMFTKVFLYASSQKNNAIVDSTGNPFDRKINSISFNSPWRIFLRRLSKKTSKDILHHHFQNNLMCWWRGHPNMKWTPHISFFFNSVKSRAMQDLPSALGYL